MESAEEFKINTIDVLHSTSWQIIKYNDGKKV